MKVFAAFLLLASTAMADNCHIVQKRAFVLDTGLTIVPFAVATPVAVVAPGSPVYSYRGPQAYQAAQPQVDAAEWAAFQQWKRSQVNVASASLVQQNCIKCHTAGGDGFDNFDMTNPLTAEQQVEASRAILSGKMPRGKTIDDKTRGNLLGELVGVKE